MGLQEEYLALCGFLQKEAEAGLAAAGIPGPAEIDVLEVWCRLTARHGAAPEEAVLRELSRTFRSLSTEKLRLYPGAAELLDRLRQCGKRVVLLTNAQESFTSPELEQLGISRVFDRILISSEAGVKKPSPAFFAMLGQNGFLPAESVMIGNDDICDCRGAASAGMDSMYIRTEQSPKRHLPLPKNCRKIIGLAEVF